MPERSPYRQAKNGQKAHLYGSPPDQSRHAGGSAQRCPRVRGRGQGAEPQGTRGMADAGRRCLRRTLPEKTGPAASASDIDIAARPGRTGGACARCPKRAGKWSARGMPMTVRTQEWANCPRNLGCQRASLAVKDKMGYLPSSNWGAGPCRSAPSREP